MIDSPTLISLTHDSTGSNILSPNKLWHTGPRLGWLFRSA